MTAYHKVDGEWVAATRPYIKRNNVWVPAREVNVKRSGVWATAYKYDLIPPPPPEMTLQIISNRYIRVGVRIPGVHREDVKKIRVLAGGSALDSKYPSSPLGAGYLSGNDANYPREDWSDWIYNTPSPNNPEGDHGPTSDYDYKEYPVNPTANTNLPGGRWYRFSAWTQDFDGNWSTGTQNAIWMPKEGVKAAKVIEKETQVRANTAGSIPSNTGTEFVSGQLLMRDSPRSHGVWHHGGQFTASVGAHGAPTITLAQIRVSRRPDDGGQAAARVNLYWHSWGGSTDLPMPASEMNDVTDVGSINRGETKWFNIPSAWWPKFNTQIKGFGLKAGTEATDYLIVKGLDEDLRCGEVHLVWEEAL